MPELRAVVLAAGEGSRMWPLAENKPKHLLPVAGKPILSHVLQALAECSVREVVVVIGFRGDLIRSALGDGNTFGLQISYLQQDKLTGTASALRLASSSVGKEPFLAVYGDLWINSSAVQAVLEKAHDCPRVIGLVRMKNPSDYGVVKVDGDRVRRIVEKPARSRVEEGWVNTGIYALDASVFEYVEKAPVSKRAEYELTSSLQRLLFEGKDVRAAVVAREDWLDVGRPWDLLEANERVLAKLQHRVKGTVEPGAVLKGPTWLEQDAVVKSGSYIEGPAFIGKGCRIGPNARIRPYSSLGDGVIIGSYCEIKNSIVMRATRIPHLSYVGDSLIGENCNLGAGTITANIRFDAKILSLRVKGRLQSTGRKKLGVIMGDDVQTGINVSIMPGVRIGSGAWVAPGAVISSDIPSGHAIFVKHALTTRRLKKPHRQGFHVRSSG